MGRITRSQGDPTGVLTFVTLPDQSRDQSRDRSTGSVYLVGDSQSLPHSLIHSSPYPSLSTHLLTFYLLPLPVYSPPHRLPPPTDLPVYDPLTTPTSTPCPAPVHLPFVVCLRLSTGLSNYQVTVSGSGPPTAGG